MGRCKVTGKALAELRDAVYERSQGMCDYCGTGLPDEWHLHHRQLRSGLGADTLANCVALHARCHDRVHVRVGQSMGWGFLVSRYAHDPYWVPVYTHQRAWRYAGETWEANDVE